MICYYITKYLHQNCHLHSGIKMEKHLASRISLLDSWFRYPTEILSFLAYYMYVLTYVSVYTYMCKYVSSIYIMVYVQRENAKKMSHLKTFFDKTSWLIILSKKADEKIMMTSFLSISASTFLLCINRVMAHHWWGWGRGGL